MFKTIVLISTFLSGICGLAYQVYWQKYLSFLVGSEAKSIALLIAVFLFGLASGYEFWGRKTEKIKEKEVLLRLYGIIEFGIGLFAILFPYIFVSLQSLIAVTPNHFAFDLLVTILAVFLPTFLMGGTVPILTSYLPDTEDEVNTAHARIYGLNSLGAFCGVILGALSIHFLGLAFSITLFGCVNVAMAIIFYLNKEPGVIHKTRSVPQIPNSLGDKGIYLLVLLTGMVSIGLEVILVRALGLAIGMNHLVYPIILSLFILGLALGSLSLSKKEVTDSKTVLIELYKVIFFTLIIFFTIPLWPNWTQFIRGSLTTIPSNYPVYFFLIFLFTAVFLIPLLISFGRLLPLGYSLLQKSGQDYGKKCGQLYFFNTIGTLLGSLFLGYFFFSFTNLDGILKISIVLLLGVVALVTFKEKKLYLYSGIVGILAIPPLFFHWDRSDHFIGTFRERNPIRNKRVSFFKPLDLFKSQSIYFKDGPNTTVSVIEKNNDLFTSYSISTFGKVDGATRSAGDFATMNMASILPYLFSPNRSDLQAAVIGMGTGMTAGHLGSIPDVKKVDQLEISEAVLGAAPYMREHNYKMDQNPKIKNHKIDAFKFFAGNKRQGQYDIISSEPSNAWVIGVENLYTSEFYGLIKNALTSDGIFLQWTSLYISNPEIFSLIISNLTKEFNHIRLYYGAGSDILFVAGSKPFDDDLARKKLSLTQVKDPLSKVFPEVSWENIEFVKVMDNDEIQYLGIKNFHKTHNFNHPTLGIKSNYAFFSNSYLKTENMLSPFVARKFIDGNNIEKDHLYFLKNLKDFCLKKSKHFGSVQDTAFCKRSAILQQGKTLMVSTQEPIKRLQGYAVLRKERFLEKMPLFLKKMEEELDKDFNQNLSVALVEEWIKDGDFKKAQSLINNYKEKLNKGNLSRLQHNLQKTQFEWQAIDRIQKNLNPVTYGMQ